MPLLLRPMVAPAPLDARRAVAARARVVPVAPGAAVGPGRPLASPAGDELSLATQ
jgi:hypothetical protein